MMPDWDPPDDGWIQPQDETLDEDYLPNAADPDEFYQEGLEEDDGEEYDD